VQGGDGENCRWVEGCFVTNIDKLGVLRINMIGGSERCVFQNGRARTLRSLVLDKIVLGQQLVVESVDKVGSFAKIKLGVVTR
jgi:hypothetical protein